MRYAHKIQWNGSTKYIGACWDCGGHTSQLIPLEFLAAKSFFLTFPWRSRELRLSSPLLHGHEWWRMEMLPPCPIFHGSRRNRASDSSTREWLLPSGIYSVPCFFLYLPHPNCATWLVKSMGRYVMAYINMQQLERELGSTLRVVKIFSSKDKLRILRGKYRRIVYKNSSQHLR